MPYAFGAVYFIFCVLSISSPPDAATVELIVTEKEEGDTLLGFSNTPENTNDLTPLLSGPDVIKYDTSILALFSSFLPRTPSPNNISYLSSSISSKKNTFDVPSTPSMLSAIRYGSLNDPPVGYTLTLIVLVSMFLLSRINLCDLLAEFITKVLVSCVPSFTATSVKVATPFATCAFTSSNTT